MTVKRHQHCEQCGSEQFYKTFDYQSDDLAPIWSCANCGDDTPRLEFITRNEGEFTKSQQGLISRLEATRGPVEAKWAGYNGIVTVRWTNGEEHALLKTTFYGFLARDGRLSIKSASQLGCHESHEVTLAELERHHLRDNRVGRVSVKMF